MFICTNMTPVTNAILFIDMVCQWDASKGRFRYVYVYQELGPYMQLLELEVECKFKCIIKEQIVPNHILNICTPVHPWPYMHIHTHTPTCTHKRAHTHMQSSIWKKSMYISRSNNMPPAAVIPVIPLTLMLKIIAKFSFRWPRCAALQLKNTLIIFMAVKIIKFHLKKNI